MPGEQADELELDWREVHLVAVTSNPSGGEIDHQLADLQPSAASGPTWPRQDGPEALEQLIPAERLGYKIVGSSPIADSISIGILPDRRTSQ
jgi:hypothetical protein